MKGLRSLNTFVSITTRGVSVGKILKKKKVLITKSMIIMHKSNLTPLWKGPKTNCKMTFAIDP